MAGGAAAVLLPILLLGGAAACKKAADAGGVAYVDPIFQKSYLLMTDAEKNTVTDEAGMLVALRTEPGGEIMTRPDGGDATMVLEYPCFVHEKKLGKTVLEVANFTVKLPSHWEFVPDTKNIRLISKGEELPLSTMIYSSNRESYAEVKKQLLERAKSFDELGAGEPTRSFTKAFFGKEGFFVVLTTRSQIQVSGVVQPGDFCAEVFYQCPKEEYKDGKTLFELVGIIEGK